VLLFKKVSYVKRKIVLFLIQTKSYRSEILY